MQHLEIKSKDTEIEIQKRIFLFVKENEPDFRFEKVFDTVYKKDQQALEVFDKTKQIGLVKFEVHMD
jgi:hypothetical protein